MQPCQSLAVVLKRASPLTSHSTQHTPLIRPAPVLGSAVELALVAVLGVVGVRCQKGMSMRELALPMCSPTPTPGQAGELAQR